MKYKFIKAIAFILTLLMVLSSFASCTMPLNDQNADSSNESDDGIGDANGEAEDTNGKGQDGENDSADDTDAPVSNSLPDNVFPLFTNGKYTIKVVTANYATETERSVATKLRTALKTKTKATINASTDYLKSGESYDANAYEILVGETAHEESSKTYQSSTYDAYGIKIIGRKMVFYFSDAVEGNALVEAFSKAIKSSKDKSYWVSNTLLVAKCSSVDISNIPKYEGGTQKSVDCSDNTKMIVVTSTTLNAFKTYCNTVKSSGYEQYSNRDNVDGNYFYTFTKGSTALTVYYSEGRKQARIISGPIKDIPTKDVDSTPENTTKYKPTLTMIGPSESTGNGLALIYQLPNGKFLIIDGGYFLGDRLYKELRELQPNATKFTIAGWFISHPHGDHQEGLENFVKLHGHEVDIENIYFNYVTPSYYDKLTSPDHQGEDQKEGHSVTRINELIAKYLSRTTKIVKPHTGQIYTFGKSATVEIISTIEDFLPTTLDNVNTSSMILKVTVAGTSTMVLADATKAMKEIVLKMYSSHLESDMVTLAHHGVWVDTPKMYNTVKADVLLWPSNTESAKDFYHGQTTSYSKETIRAALNQAKDVYLARGTDTVLSLPYKTVGNKQSFINNVLNG